MNAVRVTFARIEGAPIRATRAELDEATEMWRWVAWLRKWGVLGALIAGSVQAERSLYR